MQKAKKSNVKSLYFSERLTYAMKEILNHPLTIVEAPMGYGKTTAVREQLNVLKANVQWQRVYDNSINNFWKGFCSLFRSFNEEYYQSLLQLQFPNDSVSLETAINIIEKIIIPAGLIIVIDDYHVAECSQTNNFIEALLNSRVAELRIVLTTRYTHFPRLEEFKLKDYIYHIEKDIFELMPGDIIAYYKQCGISITKVEADKLFSITEGWISALYLLMLNYISGVGTANISDIFMLVDTVVYMPLPQAYKDFLLSMCIFDSFTIKQALFIWKGENPVLLLDELANKNAFIFYDAMEKKYFMHSILKGLLKDKFESKEKSFKNELYRNAAQWYKGNGEYLLSMNYAFLADDFDTLMDVVEIDKGHSFNNEYKDLLLKYFEKCPQESKQKYPFAMLVYIRRLFTFNEIDLFKKACEEFRANIEKINCIDADYKKRLLGEYELVMSFSGYNDIEKMSVYHKSACELLKTSSSILDGTASWTFGSPSVLYMFYRKSGELEKEVQTIRHAMPFYYQVTNNHGKGAEFVMEAERHYYTGDFQSAEIIMHKAYLDAEKYTQSGILICSAFLEIRLALIKGDYLSILGLIKKLREDINNKKWYLFMHTIDMCEAYVYSCLNNRDSIPLWIKNGEFKNSRLFFPSIPFLNIVYGKVLLINEEYLKLVGISQHFLGGAAVFPNILGQVYTYIYLAAANRRIFREAEARAALMKALEMALPDKVYMPFVENCEYIRPILEESRSQGIYTEDIDRILDIYKAYQKAMVKIKDSFMPEDKQSLTGREEQIAQLAADGLSNKEIGERLFISQNTVKTQLKSIFEKLGISSRVLLKDYFEEKV